MDEMNLYKRLKRLMILILTLNDQKKNKILTILSSFCFFNQLIHIYC